MKLIKLQGPQFPLLAHSLLMQIKLEFCLLSPRNSIYVSENLCFMSAQILYENICKLSVANNCGELHCIAGQLVVGNS